MKIKPNQIRKQWETVSPTGRMLRPSEVIATTGLSRSQIYSMISNDEFPPFIKLSARASALPEAWLESFIQECARVSMKQEAVK